MFSFVKKSLTKLYTTLTSPLQSLFHKKTVDADVLAELKKILIQADTGTATTQKIITSLEQQAITDSTHLKSALHTELRSLLQAYPAPEGLTQIYILVGINGSGKTTFSAKLAHFLQQQNKKVLLVAADTFRAAAQEQLVRWATQLNIDCVTSDGKSDPAAVVFRACEQFKTGIYDCMIIDTAGRLQTKTHLMQELEKMGRVITKQLPEASRTTLLTVDSMLGQNSFEQAQLFHESTTLNGIVLTKFDGTGKGGIVFSIVDKLHIPIAFISSGEKLEDITRFNAQNYVDYLLEMNHATE